MKRLPKPKFVTAEISKHYTVYGWRIDAHGLTIISDTKKECVSEFLEAFLSEYDKPFN